MKPFNWVDFKKYVIQHEIDRNIILAKAGTNTDFKNLHPDWISQAQNKNFIDLRKKVEASMIKYQENAMARRQKFV